MNVYCSNCERSVDSTNAEGLCPSCAGDDISFSPAFMARWEKAEWRRTARGSTGCPIFGGSTSTIPLAGSERSITEMRDLLAGAAALLKDKWTPDEGQLRTQWDRDVDEWLIAATPLFEEEER